MSSTTLERAVGRMEDEVEHSTAERLPILIGELERLKTVAQAKLYGSLMQPPAPTAEPWVSVEKVSAHLGLSKDTIYDWCNLDNGMPHQKIGRQKKKFLISEVDAWVQAGGLTRVGRPTSS